MLGSYIICNWLILQNNALYLYQEVCSPNISSGIVKDMKVDPRNKLRKAGSLNLDTSSILATIEDN